MVGERHVASTRAVRVWVALGSLVLLTAQPAGAQAVDLFGGVSELVVRNASENLANPSGGHVTVPTFGGAVGWKDRTVGFHIEVDLPRTFTNRTPGAIKSGPVTYVVTQRNLIVGGLVYRSFGNSKVRLKGLAGFSVVRNQTSTGYDFQIDPHPPAENHGAFSGGVDLTASFGHVALTLPRVRVHYVSGIIQDPSGFAIGRVLLTVGATVGWRF